MQDVAAYLGEYMGFLREPLVVDVAEGVAASEALAMEILTTTGEDVHVHSLERPAPRSRSVRSA